MMSIIYWLAVILIILTTALLLIHKDWRWFLGLLAVQYVAVFALTLSQWSFGMAIVKLLIGLAACAILGMTQLGNDTTNTLASTKLQSRYFSLLASALVCMVAFSFSIQVSAWLGIDLPVGWGSLVLIGLGLLHLGMSAQPMRVIVGILTGLSGFEIIYAAVESSILVATLLSLITLGMALTGAFLLNQVSLEAEK